MELRAVSLDELTIDDEASVADVALYARLKRALGRSGHRFLIPAVAGAQASWDRVLFLNLTYWSGPAGAGAGPAGAGSSDGADTDGGEPDSAGADVLCDEHIPADVVAHVAWHLVAGRQLASGAPCAEALLFAEAIASAFDLYLVGRLLVDAPDCDFIATQVPRMAEAAGDAGLPAEDFTALMQAVCRDPERAFEDMRALLLDVATALLACRGAVEAERALGRFAAHRFMPLLHHYELSTWILSARAHAGPPSSTPDARSARAAAAVAAADRSLRKAPISLAWLADHWIDADQPTGA